MKFGDLNDVFWLLEMFCSKRVYFVDLVLEYGEDIKCLRKEGDYGCELCLSGCVRRVLLLRGGVKSFRRFVGCSRVCCILIFMEEIL